MPIKTTVLLLALNNIPTLEANRLKHDFYTQTGDEICLISAAAVSTIAAIAATLLGLSRLIGR